MNTDIRKNGTEKRKKILAICVRGLIILLAGLLLGINIYLLNAETLVGNGMPMPFGIGASVVLSGSMEPEIHVDDLIFVKAVGDGNYEIGDVVVYQTGKTLVVHRIKSISGEGDAAVVVTRGDANNIDDDPITLADIKGRVTGRIGGVGALVRFLKSPLGTVIIIGLALLFLELSFRKEKDTDDKELDSIKEEIRRLQKEQQDKNG